MATRTKNQNTYIHGDWNVECDVCGFKFKASDIKKRWDNAYVCADDWEPRHPMDFQKGIKDDPSVPFTRPTEPQTAFDTFGDESPTLVWDTNTTTVIFNEELTANRTYTFTGTPSKGDRWCVIRLLEE